MNKQEIKAFLMSKKGYLKEGSKRLRNLLRDRGFETTIKDCKSALKECNQEVKYQTSKIKNKEAKVLIYDIETSPNIGWFWRAGYKLNLSPENIIKERAIICVSYKWQGESEVYNLTWDKNQCDKFLIEQFIDVLNEADIIVAHNGDNFDIKWLRTRALVHGLHKNMLPNYRQFDTLKVAKSKLYLNSNRLDYISKLLGFEGKNKTSIDLWLDIVYKNCKVAMNTMLDYCDEDVRQLEKVYNELQYLENPYVHSGVLNDETKQTSPITGTYNIKHVKTVTSNRGTIKHIMKDVETERMFEMSDTNYKKFLEIK